MSYPDYLDYGDGSGYPYDEFEYDEYEDDDADYDEDRELCIEITCYLPSSDYCQCCGMPLCHMHNEIGCGFCSNCPTLEWIDEQHTAAHDGVA